MILMSSDDKAVCADVIQAWGLFRDQGRWAELLETFHPEGHISVSWFSGPFAEFVDRCRQNFQVGNSRAKHLIWPSVVRVSGDRALAESNVAIMVRQDIGGVRTDVTSLARFLDRLERRQQKWAILERAAIYEQDRLDPVEPSAAFAELIKRADAANYPEAVRYMAYRLAAAGRSLASPVYCAGSAESEQLYARFNAWLGP
jgi:SnoaL-like protein